MKSHANWGMGILLTELEDVGIDAEAGDEGREAALEVHE